MAKGNRGFADLVVRGEEAGRVPARLPPRTGILTARESRLADLARGAMVTRVHEFVDPARCRIWEGHNRDYASLTPENCADLIESLRAQGRQEMPAIVRRVSGDPEHEFEVICGARRHWAISWLRANNFPEFGFLVEPRELSDEEAFRLADLENRNRRDLSDFERAADYARALERYYGGSQQRMAERLEVSKSWLSRYLDLARLPNEIVAAFGLPNVIGISHAAQLAPLLRAPRKRQLLLDAAAGLVAEQSSAGVHPALPPATVVRRLVGATEGRSAKPARPREHAVKGSDGAVLAEGRRAGKGGALSITVPVSAARRRGELMNAIKEILEALLETPIAPPAISESQDSERNSAS